MANVNNFTTHYQETIKMSKAQKNVVRNLLSLNLPIKERAYQIKEYLLDRFELVNIGNKDTELIVRVGALHRLSTTYYFNYKTEIISILKK